MAATQLDLTSEKQRAADPDSTRWIWRQEWRDVLFLHWRMDAAGIRPHVAPALEIDTFRGAGWVSAVVFRLAVAPIGWPRVPGFSSLVEVNLRTYVRLANQPGIYFLSIHADNLAALSLARTLTPLPYAWASLGYRPDASRCQCELRRVAAPAVELVLQASIGTVQCPSEEASAMDWLLERYRAFVPARRSVGKLLSAEVAHEPWQVAAAHVQSIRNTLGAAWNLALDRPPELAHFCRQMQARFSRFEPAQAPRGLETGSTFAPPNEPGTIEAA